MNHVLLQINAYLTWNVHTNMIIKDVCVKIMNGGIQQNVVIDFNYKHSIFFMLYF